MSGGEGIIPVSGILNVNKPAGLTSHDVVDRVRRLFGQKRVGHAGTLDPLATGVLVVCVGWTTRLSEYLMEGPKRYVATLRFGATTDTYDVEGEVIDRRPVDVDASHLESALAEFVGEIEQRPPAFSAIKRDGVPLHRLARRGQVVEPPTRVVTVERITLLDWDRPNAKIDLTCSKGTYVRSLVHDLGQRLGCGAHLTALVRTASGPFELAEALTLDELAQRWAANASGSMFFPLERALPGFDMVSVQDEEARRVQRGQPLEGRASQSDRQLALAVSAAGEALAVLRYQVDANQWQPVKVFV